MRAVCPETGDTGVREVVFRGRRRGRFHHRGHGEHRGFTEAAGQQNFLNAEVAEERRVKSCIALLRDSSLWTQ